MITRITPTVILLVIVLNVYCQEEGEYFAPVQWGTQPRNINWAENPHNDSYVVVPCFDSLYIDIDTISFEKLRSFWDSAGNQNFIKGYIESSEAPDYFDLDDTGTGTFGASWKGFYTPSAFYVIFKFKDTEKRSRRRWFEVALQTKEHTRYEAGWQAASKMDTAGVGYRIMNDQYGRFRELGGMKLLFHESDTITIVQNTSSAGQTGIWTSGIGDTNVGKVTSFQENDYTLWYLLELEFADLKFYKDEWGLHVDSNFVSMDPDIQYIISFEPAAFAEIGTKNYRAWWNGVNDAYKMIYYSGKVEFGPKPGSPPRPPHVSNSEISYCRGEDARPVEAKGTDLKWYDAENNLIDTGSFTPPTDRTGNTNYYVTQSNEYGESEPSEVTVDVYWYRIILEEQVHICDEDVTITASTNYRGISDETYEWYGDFGDFTGQTVTFNTDTSGTEHLNAITASGCMTGDSIYITPDPMEVGLKIAVVSTSAENGNNTIFWYDALDLGVDSLLIMTREALTEDPFERLAEFDYMKTNGSYTDTREKEIQDNSEYLIHLVDKCGNLTEPWYTLFPHQPVRLAGSGLSTSFFLQWSAYKGRNVKEYQLLKGPEPDEISIIHATTDQNYNDSDPLTDTTYYRIKTTFYGEYPGGDEMNFAYSNLLKAFPSGGSGSDTVTVYDTVYVAVTDTLIIDASFIGVNEIENNPHIIKVYPNPAKDILYIKSDEETAGAGLTFRIINELGVVVEENKLTDTLWAYNLKSWTGGGLYFLYVIDNDGVIRDIKKIILK
ncbi:MAG: T9SS type A sorting domain-containing protein [Bacteroidales bacterium]|nr:T9SS type A sorting domain-containing protein [Bacteroidales bacterium]